MVSYRVIDLLTTVIAAAVHISKDLIPFIQIFCFDTRRRVPSNFGNGVLNEETTCGRWYYTAAASTDTSIR